jgi:hypothetical protein
VYICPACMRDASSKVAPSPADNVSDPEVVKSNDAHDKQQAPLEQAMNLFDLDGDGDVDGDDILLGMTRVYKLLQLSYDMSISAIPFGACIGTIASLAAAVIISQALTDASVQVEGILVELSNSLDIPDFSDQHKVSNLLGIQLDVVTSWIGIALSLILVLNLLTVANGFYVGVRRSMRRVRENSVARYLCGCEPPTPGRVAAARTKLCSLGCCLFWTEGVVQSIFALVGSVVYWVVIIVSYVLTIVFLTLFAVMRLFREYCTRVAPYARIGLNFTADSLMEANATLNLAIASTEEAGKGYMAVESDVATASQADAASNDGMNSGLGAVGAAPSSTFPSTTQAADNARMLFVRPPGCPLERVLRLMGM